MIHTCIVQNCKYHKRKNFTRNIMFHPFPPSEPLRSKWIEIINNHGFKPIHIKNQPKLCELHFVPDDYVYSNDNNNQNRCLKVTAIPTVFNNDVLNKRKSKLINDNIQSVQQHLLQQQQQQQQLQQPINNTEFLHANSPLQQNTNVLNYQKFNSTLTVASSSPSYDNDSTEDYDDNENQYQVDVDDAKYKTKRQKTDNASYTSDSDTEAMSESGTATEQEQEGLTKNLVTICDATDDANECSKAYKDQQDTDVDEEDALEIDLSHNSTIHNQTNIDEQQSTKKIPLSNSDNNEIAQRQDLNASPQHQQHNQQQIDLNSSLTKLSNSNKRRSGLSDVIDKLVKQQSSNSNSAENSLSTSISSLADTTELNAKLNESPHMENVNSISNTLNSRTRPNNPNQQDTQKLNNNKHQKLNSIQTNANSTAIIISPNKILTNDNNNKSEIYRLLKRANLLTYLNAFTEKGNLSLLIDNQLV